MGRKPSETTKQKYVDNQKFYEALQNWDRQGTMPDIIGKYIQDICKNLCKSGRFNGYTWLDSMYGDALIACFKGIRNFDCNKSNNPFGFITMIAFHSFQARIKKENKLVAAKNEYMNDLNNQLYDCMEGDEAAYDSINQEASLTNMLQYGHCTTHTKKAPKTKVKKTGAIDGFI